MKLTYLLFALLICVCSCKPSITPEQLNNKYVSVTDTLNECGKAWSKKLNEVLGNKHFNELTPLRQHMQLVCNNERNDVKTTAVVANSNPYKEALINFLNCEDTLFVTAAMPFEKFDSTTAVSLIDDAYANLINKSKQEQQALGKLDAAGKKYADENDLIIPPSRK